MIRFLYIIIIITLTSCSDTDISKPLAKTERQSIFGAPITFSSETGGFGSINVGDKSHSNTSDKVQMPVNKLLWISTLDILDFMALEKIDPFGGIIMTKWFINENNDNIRNKITISFSNSELKATSIKVSVTREKFKNDKWIADGHSDGLARKIEDLILSRARELRNSSN